VSRWDIGSAATDEKVLFQIELANDFSVRLISGAVAIPEITPL
jgi:hypothetical protein